MDGRGGSLNAIPRKVVIGALAVGTAASGAGRGGAECRGVELGRMYGSV